MTFKNSWKIYPFGVVTFHSWSCQAVERVMEIHEKTRLDYRPMIYETFGYGSTKKIEEAPQSKEPRCRMLARIMVTIFTSKVQIPWGDFKGNIITNISGTACLNKKNVILQNVEWIFLGESLQGLAQKPVITGVLKNSYKLGEFFNPVRCLLVKKLGQHFGCRLIFGRNFYPDRSIPVAAGSWYRWLEEIGGPNQLFSGKLT